MKKNAKKTPTAPPKSPSSEAAPKPTTSSGPAVTPTPELIAMMRSADNLDAAIAVLAPPSRTRLDATYRLTASTEPLPAKRGIGLMVFAVAVRINAPFKSADIVAALPDAKGAKYWVGKLVKSGHLEVV